MPSKLTVATCSLAGCFGCHMSFLDQDEALLDLLDRVELDRSPFTDRKRLRRQVDVGLVEGGVDSTATLRTLLAFRAHCRVLVSLGECAITGNVPALRNAHALRDCLEEAFVRGCGLVDPGIPGDPELPRLLERVRCCHELVRIDHFLPGCPPPAEAIDALLADLAAGRAPRVPRRLLRYD